MSGELSSNLVRSDEDDNLYLFRSCLLLLVILHAIIAFFIEGLVAGNDALHRPSWEVNNDRLKNRYKVIEQDLAYDQDWPPISRATTSEILSLS